jgi:hypothetical protein
MSAPASLNVSVSFTGLSSDEFRAMLRHMPSRARFAGDAIQPAIGGMRYEVAVTNLSIQGAADVTSGLLAYLSDERPLADWERELIEAQAAATPS